MRSNSAGQSESGSKIALQILNFLNVFHQFGIDSLLNFFGCVFPFSLGLLAGFGFFGSGL